MFTKRALFTILAAGAVLAAVGIGPRFTGSARALPPAQAGVTIPYSGRLSDEAGGPVADGAYDFTFALYAAESGGEPLWTETQEDVAVQGGAFTVLLGRVAPLPQEVLEGGSRWLEVGVRGPGEFEALNQDFRYQLPPIGAPMPNLYIAQKIQGNRFKIAGGVPGKEVSWQVTGIRHDPFAERNRIPMEEDKPAEERGTYLYPEGYGQPKEKGLDYQRNPELFRPLLAAPAPQGHK